MSDVWKQKVVKKSYCVYCNQTYSKTSIRQHLLTKKHSICKVKNIREGARRLYLEAIYQAHHFFGWSVGLAPIIMWVKCPKCEHENEHGMNLPPALDYVNTRVCHRCGYDYRLPLQHLLEDD